MEEIRDKNYKCKCKSQFYIILALSIVIIGSVIFTILQVRRIRLCRGQLFLNVVKIMLFISDVQYYNPVKLWKMAGMLCKAVQSGGLFFKLSRGNYIAYDCVYCKITTAHLQVLFSLHHLGRITKILQ